MSSSLSTKRIGCQSSCQCGARASKPASGSSIRIHLFKQQYLLDEVLPRNTVRLATLNRQLIGFVAASRESVAQLYVRVGFQRCGCGSHLLAWAMAQSSGSLWLYTFARNAGACAFYEKHGFVAGERGFEPAWQLEDVKYHWVASAQSAPCPPAE